MDQVSDQGNHPSTFKFTTSLELTHILSTMTGLGEDLLSIKTEFGPLSGEITIKRGHKDGFASMKTNKSLFVCSKTSSGHSTTFTALSDKPYSPTNTLNNYSNDLFPIARKALIGFSKRPRFRFFHMPANIRLMTYHCTSHIIEEKLENDGTNFSSIANLSNTVLPPTTALNQFRKIA